MTRDQALAAIDASFAADIDRLGAVFVSGLATGESIPELAARFDRGFDLAVTSCEARKAQIAGHFKETAT